MDRWVGKVAVVTGASNNIGSAITVDLVKAGMIVIGLARRKELVEDLRKFIPIHTNGKLYAVKCDVSNELDVARAFGWIFAEVGVVNVLVNCEEMKLNSTITTEGNEDELKSVLQTNLWSAVLCTKKAVEIMKRQRITDAHIININSADGHKIPATKLDKPLMNMYPVSKFGLTALTEILRREFRFDRVGYKITSISPSQVADEIIDDFEFNKIKRPDLRPIDVAQAVLYVLGTPKSVLIAELKINAIEKAW